MAKLLAVFVGLTVFGGGVIGEIVTGFPSKNEIVEIFGKQLARQLESNTTRCELQLQTFIANLTSFKELWAIEMFDAWGKLPAGILSGNFYAIGDYDQCRKVSHQTQQQDIGLIRGRYCQITVPLDVLLPASGRQTARGFPSSSKSVGLTIGSCLPDSCEASELKPLLDSTIGMLLNTSDLGIKCDIPVPDPGTKEIVAIVFFTIVAALMIFSTAFDVFARITARSSHPALTMFSVYSNGIKLFTVNKRPPSAAFGKSDQIDCLNGIRVLSMVWIVFCHDYLALISSPMSNPTSIYDWVKYYHSMLVIAGTVSVDSFFMMSGLLIAWSVLKELNASRKLNVPMMYLHRYLRLTPAFAALILFTSTLMKYCGSGPFWNSLIANTEDACDRYWWSALLYVQNYVNRNKMCLGHSWYLSVDMQLYLLSPLIIYPLWRWGRRVLIVIAGLILASMGCVLATFLVNSLRLAFVDARSSDRSRMALTYQPTHTRMGAWLLGVILGYVFFKTKHRLVILSKVVVTVGWTVSLAAMAAIIFGDYPFQQPDTYTDHSVVWDAIYESTNRVAWAGCLGWIVFACVNGYGGPINTLLSLSMWQPLGRLSYSIYLLHLPLQMMLTGSLRSTVHFGDIAGIHKFWGDFGLTLTLAVLWSLAFESPIVILEKLLFRSPTKPSSERSLVPDNQSQHSGNASTASLPAKDPV